MNNVFKVLVATALLSLGQFASAAVVTIDDTDINSYTISWSSFAGFSVNGLGNTGAGSLTFDDSVIADISASFVDFDANFGEFFFDVGANSGSAGDVTSQLAMLLDGSPAVTALLFGEFKAYTGGVYNTDPTNYVQGDVIINNAIHLTINYLSEAGELSSVPAPPMLALFGLALLGLGVRRQRQH